MRPIHSIRLVLATALASGMLSTVVPVASVFAQTDTSGYRTDTPPTLTAPPQPPRVLPENVLIDEFSRRYNAAGRPRAVLFWSREVDDEMGVEFETTRLSRDGSRRTEQSMIETTAGPAGTAQLSDSEISETRDREATRNTRRIDSGARDHSLGERNDWVLESSFTTTLQQAGLRLIDRSIAMRAMQAKGNVSSPNDQQLIEARALADAADWVIEVKLTPDPNAALAWAFRIDVTDTHSGEILSRTFSQGYLPDPDANRHRPFVAGQRGFERAKAVELPVTMENVGRQVAIEALAALAKRLPG